MIADELKAAINDYPAEWIPEAFKEAVKANVRKWNYTRAILERWKTSGRGETNKANKNGMSALELA